MNSYEIIRLAIRNKTSVSAFYDGHYRILSPHAIGATKTGARINVHSVQTGGSTSDGPIGPMLEGNWKCMHLDKLTNVAPHDDPWQTAGNHSVPSWCIHEKHYEVDY